MEGRINPLADPHFYGSCDINLRDKAEVSCELIGTGGEGSSRSIGIVRVYLERKWLYWFILWRLFEKKLFIIDYLLAFYKIFLQNFRIYQIYSFIFDNRI